MEQRLHTHSDGPLAQAAVESPADISTNQVEGGSPCHSQDADSPGSEVPTPFSSEASDAETTTSPVRGALALQVGILTAAAALGVYAANGGRAHRARHLKMQNGGLNKKQPMPERQKLLRRRKRR
jgi:hypothetical protein